MFGVRKWPLDKCVHLDTFRAVVGAEICATVHIYFTLGIVFTIMQSAKSLVRGEKFMYKHECRREIAASLD